MDEKMRLVRRVQTAREGEEQLDIPALGGGPTGLRFYYVVKAQPQPPVYVEDAQRLGFGPARIENRQHMGDTSRAMAGKLVDPANRQLKGHQALVIHAFHPEFDSGSSLSIAGSCGEFVHEHARSTELRPKKSIRARG